MCKVLCKNRKGLSYETMQKHFLHNTDGAKRKPKETPDMGGGT